MKYFLLILTALFVNQTFAQVEDEACTAPGKKTAKLLVQANASNDPKTAVDLYLAALKLEPEKAQIYYDYGIYAYDLGQYYFKTYPEPSRGNSSFEKAEELLERCLELCDDFHANALYVLGVINFSQQDKETATEYFRKYQNYKSSDPAKYPDDHAKKLADIKEVLGDWQSEEEIKSKTVPFNPTLVRNVSSPKDEYFPMISPDNELMFFTRKLDRSNLGDMQSRIVEEFTIAKRPDMYKDFNEGEPLKKPFNDGSFDNYGAATMAVDNKEMIICACRTEEVYGQQYKNCDLYTTTYVRTGAGGNDFVWTELKNMGPGINTKDGWEGQPSLSADGNTLFYTSTRKGSRDNDIYIAEREPDGTWGTARPFDEINTDGKDKSPFLHQDSETLYFVSSVSDKRKGVGGTDIFYTRNVNGKWTEPKNIGYPINSEADEIGLFVSIDGELAYFSSRVKGDWNIYAFELHQEARPQRVALIKGELKDDMGENIEDATVEIAYANSEVVEKIRVNGNDGKYAAIVKTKDAQDVMVTVKKEGHAFDSKLIEKEQLTQPKQVAIKNADLAVKELKSGEAYTINDILFATNSYALNEKSKFILRSFARYLKENPSIKLAIQGHTDDIGDDAKNLQLSKDRAQEVMRYLVSQGIDQKRLTSEGFGETKPKVANTSEANRAKNRRTDFVIEGL